MLRHAWPLIVAQRRDAGIGLVLSLLAVAAALYLPWPMKVIVDSILTDKTPLPAWLPAEKLPALAAVCGILLAMHFLRGWRYQLGIGGIELVARGLLGGVMVAPAWRCRHLRPLDDRHAVRPRFGVGDAGPVSR